MYKTKMISKIVLLCILNINSGKKTVNEFSQNKTIIFLESVNKITEKTNPDDVMFLNNMISASVFIEFHEKKNIQSDFDSVMTVEKSRLNDYNIYLFLQEINEDILILNEAICKLTKKLLSFQYEIYKTKESICCNAQNIERELNIKEKRQKNIDFYSKQILLLKEEISDILLTEEKLKIKCNSKKTHIEQQIINEQNHAMCLDRLLEYISILINIQQQLDKEYNNIFFSPCILDFKIESLELQKELEKNMKMFEIFNKNI